MLVPLDRLYNHVSSICNHDSIIYRFYPHGSKKPEDLNALYPYKWLDTMTRPSIIMHDQEPLDFDFYQENRLPEEKTGPLTEFFKFMNLRGAMRRPYTGYDLIVLVHSERNSQELLKYENQGYIGAHWWAHAAIARDWYRYAEFDINLKVNFDAIEKDFLIYNRAWAGSREYRLKFAELLLLKNLTNSCKTTLNPMCDGIHYTKHVWKNENLKINSTDLERFYSPTNSTGLDSADYDSVDYQTTGIEVVLETLFDDSRNHLTEKTLRPIACGRPFILASTPNSLDYIRTYGFKTFSPFINEHYDTIQDPTDRLESIVQEMKRISLLPEIEKKFLWNELYRISKHNQELFFSKHWSEHIWNELNENINTALAHLQKGGKGKYWHELQTHSTDRLLGIRDVTPNELQRFISWISND